MASHTVRPWLALLAAAPLVLFAQTATNDDAWLNSPEAKQFRDRVVLLALIYGESSGVDPQGFMVRTRLLRPLEDGCGDVDVVTLRADQPLRQETVHTCRHP